MGNFYLRWGNIGLCAGFAESAYLKQVTKEGSEQLRLTFEKGELKAVNDEKFDDPIKAIQKWKRSVHPTVSAVTCTLGIPLSVSKGVGFEAAAPMLIIGAHRFLEKYTLSKVAAILERPGCQLVWNVLA